MCGIIEINKFKVIKIKILNFMTVVKGIKEKANV